MKKVLSAAAIVAFISMAAPAYAFHCPVDMKKIDAALAAHPSLSAEKMTQVKELRHEGEKYHKAGKHQESVDALAKAMKLLGVM